jgi:hypothetical protein
VNCDGTVEVKASRNEKALEREIHPTDPTVELQASIGRIHEDWHEWMGLGLISTPLHGSLAASTRLERPG